jgi:hypothetical protein
MPPGLRLSIRSIQYRDDVPGDRMTEDGIV